MIRVLMPFIIAIFTKENRLYLDKMKEQEAVSNTTTDDRVKKN